MGSAHASVAKMQPPATPFSPACLSVLQKKSKCGCGGEGGGWRWDFGIRENSQKRFCLGMPVVSCREKSLNLLNPHQRVGVGAGVVRIAAQGAALVERWTFSSTIKSGSTTAAEAGVTTSVGIRGVRAKGKSSVRRSERNETGTDEDLGVLGNALRSHCHFSPFQAYCLQAPADYGGGGTSFPLHHPCCHFHTRRMYPFAIDQPSNVLLIGVVTCAGMEGAYG
jgi:hypothetical protein